MGVTIRRLLPLALVVVAILAALFAGRNRRGEEEPRESRLVELANRRYVAMTLWTALEQRDSANAALARWGESGSFRFSLQGFSPRADAAKLQQTVADLLRSVGTMDSAVRVGALIYNADRYDPRNWWGMYMGAWIARRDGHRWCVAILPGTEQPGGRLQAGGLAGRLAPCLVLAAFGEPGPGVLAWLEGTRFSTVQSNNWLSRPRGWRDGHEQAPWRSSYDPSWFETTMSMRSIRLWEFRVGAMAMSLAPPYQLGTLALRCLVGDVASCGRAAADTTAIAGQLGGLPSGLSIGLSASMRTTASLLEPRPLSGWYLSDLIRDQGRERFKLFWKSVQPLEEAFRSAFGEEIGSWTLRWARAQWEASVDRAFGNREIILGATLAPSWPLLVIGWTALVLAAVAWAAKRRQVT